jgi:hypothetical protein
LPFRQRQPYCRRKRHIVFRQNFGLNSRIFSLLVSIELLIEEWYISYPPVLDGEWKSGIGNLCFGERHGIK